MAKAEKVTLRNEKDRSYNGINLGQTITVDVSESISYLSAGFVPVAPAANEEADAKAVEKAEKDAAEANTKQEADAKAAAGQK
jgi:hypothetical protein